MDTNSEQSAIQQFLHQYTGDSNLVSREQDNCGEYLRLEDPVALAALVAFCSNDHKRVLLRGCCQNHPTSLPSLFREDDHYCEDPVERWSAYKWALRKLRLLEGLRWDRDNLGAVLQHYGIKTPWLDVVQNLHTAVWFATHELEADAPSRRTVRRSTETDGWISLYVDGHTSPQRLCVIDLRDAHSSRHVRPHAQQGLSLAMQCDPKTGDRRCPPDACTVDFNKHRVARVQFPAQSERWMLSGHMFSPQFLFPPAEHDDSLQKLDCTEVQEILHDARERHSLTEDALGAVYTVGVKRATPFARVSPA